MFTGIVEEIGYAGRVVSSQPTGEIYIRAGMVLEGTKPGDSISVNGVCLTAKSLLPDGFLADVMPETLRRTNLGQLSPGSPVNLERALAADGRFGGHIVTGHIDGTGIIRSARREGNAVWVTVEAGKEILDLTVLKGSIAVDGISLTVAELTAHTFSVSLIPHTGARTILLSKKAGETVNLENDIVGKYIRRILTAPAPERESRSMGSRCTESRCTGSGSMGSGISESRCTGRGITESRNTGGRITGSRITEAFLSENGF